MSQQETCDMCSQGSISTVCDSPIIALRSNASLGSELKSAAESQSCPMLALSQMDMDVSILSAFDGDKEMLSFGDKGMLEKSQSKHDNMESDLERLRKITAHASAISANVFRKHLNIMDLKSICNSLDSKRTSVLNKSGLCDMLYSSIVSHGSVERFISFIETERSFGFVASSAPEHYSHILGKRKTLSNTPPLPPDTSIHENTAMIVTCGGTVSVDTPVLLSATMDPVHWRSTDSDVACILENGLNSDECVRPAAGLVAPDGFYLQSISDPAVWNQTPSSTDLQLLDEEPPPDFQRMVEQFFFEHNREFVALNLKLRSSSVEGSSSLQQTKSSEESTASDMNQWLQSLLGPEEESEDHLSATVDLGSSPSLVVDDKSAASTAVLTCQLVPRRGLSKATQTQEHSNISPAVECSFPSTHSSGKTLGCVTTDGSVTASSFHTQTGDACLQSSIGWDCRYDAVKRVRFNEEKIGLIIVKGRRMQREVAEIKGKKRQDMKDGAYNLLCVGDVIVSIQGTPVEGLSFDDQLSKLRTTSRPLFLEFLSSETSLAI